MSSITTNAVTGSSNLIAAIDIGSNSIHLVLAQLNESHTQFRILEQRREKVRLAAGLNEQNVLSEEAIKRGLDCLTLFSQRLRGLPAESVSVVGTNALRKAVNRDDFIRQAEQVLNHKIEIISGREEARLIYSGVSHDDEQQNTKRLVVDIGGGSTEFILGVGFDPKHLESLQMGCVSFTKMFFSDENHPITQASFRKAVVAAKQELNRIRVAYLDQGWELAIGSSGTIRAVHKVLVSLGLTKKGIRFDGLEALREGLIQHGSAAYLKSYGLTARREQTFAGGVAVLFAIFESLKISEMHYSNSALREGLLHDIIGKEQQEDIRDFSIDRLCVRHQVDGRQADRVKHSMMDLYQKLGAWTQGDDTDLQLLQWASQVHELGLSVSHTRFHEHGGYLLENMDLFGFGHILQSELALLVRAHRRRLKTEYFEAFDSSRADVLLRLCLILRLAVILNHGRGMDEIINIQCAAQNQEVILTFPEDWLKSHLLTSSDLEQEAKYWLAVNYKLIIR